MRSQNILSWDTVMADGSIRTIDAKEEPELAVAMRGSGSQFGIVTQFNVQAYPMGKVWGGMRTYSEDKADEIFAALHNFVPDNGGDEEAAIILTNIMAFNKGRFFLIFLYYGEEEPPTTGPFAQFLNIDAMIDNTGVQEYKDLVSWHPDASSLARTIELTLACIS